MFKVYLIAIDNTHIHTIKIGQTGQAMTRRLSQIQQYGDRSTATYNKGQYTALAYMEFYGDKDTAELLELATQAYMVNHYVSVDHIKGSRDHFTIKRYTTQKVLIKRFIQSVSAAAEILNIARVEA